MKTQPSYLKLYRKLREQITAGIYSAGDRLPSKRTLADHENVSVITVEHALALLEEEGYVEMKERSGCYVIYRREHFFAAPDTGAHEETTFGDTAFSESVKVRKTGFERETKAVFSAISDVEERRPLPVAPGTSLFPFPTFARVMRKVLTEYGEQLLTKSDPFGTPVLREVLCGYLGRSRGIFVTPEQIVIGAGAEYLYSLVVQMIGRGRIYALEDPSYEKIRMVYEANGAACDFLRMGEDGILSEELMRTNAGALHVTPFRSYPSGITAGASKRREYLAWAEQRKAYIIEDDYDSEFTLQSKSVDTLFSLEPADSVLYINTFSRTIAPSMRLGYMILPANCCEMLKEKIAFYSCTVPVFEQYVLAEFIRSGEFERHINRVRRQLRRG